MSMKNPLTPAGIEPSTFRFIAQHLNQCATAVPLTIRLKGKTRKIVEYFQTAEVTSQLLAVINTLMEF